MEHSAHFYESRAMLVDWLYRAVRAEMQAGDMCVVIARPDTRATLERLLDLDFDVTAAAAWGLYAYVDTSEVLGAEIDDSGFEEAGFATWLAGLAADAGAAGRRIAIWSEIGDVLRYREGSTAAQQLERLWKAAPGTVVSVTCLYAKSSGGIGSDEEWIKAVHGLAAGNGPT